MRPITMEEMTRRGYVDVTVNLPLEQIESEIRTEESIRNPSEIIIVYNPQTKKAVLYSPKKDFGKEGARK